MCPAPAVPSVGSVNIRWHHPRKEKLMGFYAEHIVPRILDKACGLEAATPFRERAACRPGRRGRRDRVRVWPEPPPLPRRGRLRGRRRPVRRRLEAGGPAAGEGNRARTPRRPRRPAAALRRRHLRRRALDLDDVHDPRPRGRPAGAATGAAPGRHAALRRARPRTRREGPSHAASDGAAEQAHLRRLPPDPADHRPDHRCRVRDQGARPVLRAGRPEVRRRRLAGSR